MGFLLDITPGDLGFKPPFTEYQHIQNEVIDFVFEAFNDDVPVVGVSVSTGGGKTLDAVSIAEAMGVRTVYDTAFKGLEDQYLRDFNKSKQPAIGMVDIRGRNNYDCAGFSHLDCRGGSSVGCPYTKGKGCTYEVEKAIAKEARHVTTNYSYWFNVNDKANGLERSESEAEAFGENPVELLVLDEGHEAPKLLADYVSCRLYEKDAKLFGDYPMNESLDQWSRWSMQMLPVLLEQVKQVQMELGLLGRKVTSKHVDKLHKLQSLAQVLNKLAYARGDDWVVEMEVGTKYGRLWKFDCVWPGKYAKQYLFCGVPRILVMSATLKPKTLWDLGVKKEDYRFREWGRVFSGNRHRIYLCGPRKINAKGESVGIGIDRKTSREDLNRVIEYMDDQIIKPRLDRKGLIATVSYDWQRLLFEQSKHSELFIGNTQDPSSDTAMEAAEEFKKSKPPSLLVSPSFTTGWDFPMDLCEYIIIFKIPMIPVQSKIMKARLVRDPRYTDAMTMQTVEQTIGRGMRKEIDRCEVFIVDAHGRWFLYKNKDLAQAWFYPAIKQVGEMLPKPPEKLMRLIA